MDDLTRPTKQLRIAQVTSALLEHLGGAEQYCLALSRWLHDQGHDVTIITAAASPSVIESLSQAGITVRVTRTWRPYPGNSRGPGIVSKLVFHGLDVAQAARTFESITGVADGSFDVVHVHRFQGFGLGIFRSSEHPIVHTVHDHALVDTATTGIRHNEVVSRLPVAQRARTRIVNRVARGLDSIVFPTERIRDRHEALGLDLSAVRSRVLPHGWLLEHPLDPQTDRSPEFTVLYLGKLATAKGVEMLLDAWGEGIPNARLVIGGAGELAAPCVEAAERADITYLGWLDGAAKSAALSAADCLVMPSLLAESFGLVVAEATLAGLPVITNTIAAPHIVTDGVNGLVTAPSAEALRHALISLATDEALGTRLGLGAKDRAAALDFDTHGNRLLHLYEEVVCSMDMGSAPERTMPQLLVVVPTLGTRPDWLKGTLRSVTAQGPAIHLRVVAPSSADLAELCGEHGAELVRCDEPGLSRALNVGLSLNQGGEDRFRYAAWIGDDDLLAPGSSAAAIEALERRPEASAVVGRCRFIDARGDTLYVFRTPPLAAWYSQFGSDFLPQPGSVFRYAVLCTVGGLDETLHRAMDYDLFLRLRRVGPVIRVKREVAAFRLHASSISVSRKLQDSEDDLVRLANASRHEFTGVYNAVRPVTRLIDKALGRLVRARRGGEPPRFEGRPYTSI